MTVAAARSIGETIEIRAAVADEIPDLTALITASAALLSRGFYTEAQAAAAIRHVFGVDSDLVADGTYLVAEARGAIIGCGGWSRRRTLFGGDQFAARDSTPLDPTSEPARIRAFFTHPDHARRGVASRLLAACEERAAAAGFGAVELMATLPGVPFYAAAGFVPGAPTMYQAGDVPVPFVPMKKRLTGTRTNG